MWLLKQVPLYGFLMLVSSPCFDFKPHWVLIRDINCMNYEEFSSGILVCSKTYIGYCYTMLTDDHCNFVGMVTSGCPSPNLKCNISMAYVPKSLSKLHTQLKVQVRNHFIPGIVTKMPFIPHKYYHWPVPTISSTCNVYDYECIWFFVYDMYNFLGLLHSIFV